VGRNPFRETVTGFGVYGAVHRDHATCLQSGEHPMLTVDDLFDVGVTDHAQAHQIALSGQCGR
jgi:hypothetical protein